MKKYFLQTIGIPTVTGRIYDKTNVTEVINKYFEENDFLPIFNAGEYHVNLSSDNPPIGKVYPDMLLIEENSLYVYISEDSINYSIEINR